MNPSKIFVRPRPLTTYERGQYPRLKSALVRKSHLEGGTHLKHEGELVPGTTYWLRLIRAGDVVVSPNESKIEKVVPEKLEASKSSAKKRG